MTIELQKTPSAELPKPKTLGQVFAEKKPQIVAALPKNFDADRMIRTAYTEVQRNPKLLACTAESIIGSFLRAAQLGLEIGSDLGRAFLVPYDKSSNIGTTQKPIWQKKTEAQFQIGYKGLTELCYRSGKVAGLFPACVYEGDRFYYEYGINEQLRHIPSDVEPGNFTHVYLVIKLLSGEKLFKVMKKYEVDLRRARSQADKSAHKYGNQSIWDTDYDMMAIKTLIINFSRYLPLSVELQQAVALDEAADRGEQSNAELLDVNADGSPDVTTLKAPSKAAQIARELTKKNANLSASAKSQTDHKSSARQTAEEFFGADDEYLNSIQEG